MVSYSRLLNGIWFPWLLLAWIVRFEEVKEWQETLMNRFKSYKWWINRTWEMLAIGYLFGLALIYLFDQYGTLSWTGDDDPFMPGVAWGIGLSCGFLNMLIQLAISGANSTRVRNVFITAGMAFYITYVLLHDNSSGTAIISVSAGVAVIVILVVVGVISCAMSAAKRVPLDIALSFAVPLSMVFIIYGTDQFPQVSALPMAICILFGLVGWVVRAVLWNRFVFKDGDCCKRKPLPDMPNDSRYPTLLKRSKGPGLEMGHVQLDRPAWTQQATQFTPSDSAPPPAAPASPTLTGRERLMQALRSAPRAPSRQPVGSLYDRWQGEGDDEEEQEDADSCESEEGDAYEEREWRMVRD